MVKKVEYRTYALSLFHAPIAVFLAVSAMFLVCEDGQNVFDTPECFNTVRFVHIWSLLNTCAYFFQDLFFLIFVIGDTSSMGYQTYAHHSIAILTFYETAYFMNWMMIFGCMLLFIEISTIFLSLRTLMFYHGYDKCAFYNINALLTFFTFLFGRVIYQIYISVFLAFPRLYADLGTDKMSTVGVAVAV